MAVPYSFSRAGDIGTDNRARIGAANGRHKPLRRKASARSSIRTTRPLLGVVRQPMDDLVSAATS